MALTYNQAKEMARSGDAGVRAELAGRTDVKPEILYFLAGDPDPTVRRALARNAHAPHHADLLLAGDKDHEVRGSLAEKIARLAPGLSSQESDRVRAMAYDALELLARDQMVRVRSILAEALKDVANAPPEVIGRLARDAEAVVSGPVLRYSPVLTDNDLLAIIAEQPTPPRLEAIAGRKGVSEEVVDALVESDDEIAIAVLLENESAHIRENTLDRIVSRAPDHPSWHAPLVRRPQLSAKAGRRLAAFVAAELLEVLAAREDLPSNTIEAVRAEVARRLHEGDEGGGGARKSAAEVAYERAQHMQAEGRLDEDVFLAALAADDLHFARAGLAVAAGVTPATLARALDTKSAKGLVALCWKAGFSAKTAERVQRKLGVLNRADLIRAEGSRYALTEDEMQWHLEFVSGLSG